MKKELWSQVIQTMAQLRGDKGCPWDKAQNHLSLTPFLIEEAYEVLESIENKSPNKLCEELGDLLLQILFHAQIAKEEGLFDIEDVLLNLMKKIKRRHPHIFKKKKLYLTPEEVLKTWEDIKLKERSSSGGRKSLLDGIPKALPALLAAHRVQSRAAEVGFDWSNTKDVIEKVKEELNEFLCARKTLTTESRPPQADKPAARGKQKFFLKTKEELGDILFSLVNLARFIKVDPEDALRETIKKFAKRFKYIEKMSRSKKKPLKNMSLEEMEGYWKQSKRKR